MDGQTDNHMDRLKDVPADHREVMPIFKTAYTVIQEYMRATVFTMCL